MASLPHSLFEEERYRCEENERLEQAIADRYKLERNTVRSTRQRDHDVAALLKRVEENAAQLQAIYEAQTAAMEAEVRRLCVGETFNEFRTSKASFNELHMRHPAESAVDLERSFRPRDDSGVEMTLVDIENMFSPDEKFGKYLDLREFHERYINLKGLPPAKRISYSEYLDVFDDFQGQTYRIEQKHKLGDGYFNYVSNLREYLEGFLMRTRPLEDFDKVFGGIEADFNKLWDAGEVAGWQQKQSGHNGDQSTPDKLFCADCRKAFSNQNVYDAHLTGKKHMKNAKARAEGGKEQEMDALAREMASMAADLRPRAVAEREYRIKRLIGMMQIARSDTKIQLERSAGMTPREREAEMDARLEAEENEDKKNDAAQEGGEDTVYNPLKLPLNWDGKPIPYWLYKLHGLGTEFPCEICGNFVYHGRRAYEKHFAEGRHVWGLKCLGIQYGPMFREISHMEEAKNLNALLVQRRRDEIEQEENVEEMEDSHGNVMPRKIFEDLRNAGML